MVRTSAIRVLAGVVVGVVVLGGCGAPVDKAGGDPVAGPPVLKVISTRGSEEIQPFIDQLDELSGGSMTVALEAEWRHDSVTGEAESIEAVRTGTADLAVVPARAWHDAGVTSFDALIAPMAIDSYVLQEAVLRDGVVDQMLPGVDKLGLFGIGVLPGPLRNPAGITRDLLAPSDFQGATIAISPGAVADRSLRALGATPVVSAFEGADMRPFDGLEQQLSSVAGNRYDGVVRSVVADVNLWPRPLVIVGNSAAMAAFTAEQRQMLAAAAKQSVGDASDRLRVAETEALGALCQRAHLTFLDASDAQQQQLRQAFAPVIDWLTQDAQTKEFLQRIQELRSGLDPSTATAPGCAAPTPVTTEAVPANGPSPLDGIFQMTTTLEDAVAFGLAIDSGSPANTGTFTWTFSGGKFTESQSNGSTQTWADGTFVVDGETLTMTYRGGGGVGPGSNAQQQVGFAATWIWSLYHDQLTIKWIDPTLSGTEYPANYAVKPWTRIGDAPAVLTPQTAATTPN